MALHFIIWNGYRKAAFNTNHEEFDETRPSPIYRSIFLNCS